MSSFKVKVRTSGANARGAYIVPASLPGPIAIELAKITDLSDFASLVNEADLSDVTAAPAQGTVINCVGWDLRRFHRSEGEGKERVYSPTPSFALVLIVGK